MLRRNNRLRLLGNSVVPDAVRLAFCFLARGGADGGESLFAAARVLPLDSENATPMPHGGAFPACGCSVEGSIHGFRTHPVKLPLHDPDFALVIDPAAFESPKPVNPQLRSRVRQKFVQHTWATPSYANFNAVNHLTHRTKSATIAVQVRFAQDTPADRRVLPVNPELVEWIMGYRRGWTSARGVT